MVLFIMRFTAAFVVTLAIVVAALYFLRPSFSMMKSPVVEKGVVLALYNAQNKGAEDRVPLEALSGDASYCLFYDSRGHILPIPPMQDKLTALYHDVTLVKASTEFTGFSISGDKATVISTNHFSCKQHNGSKLTVTTTTRDTWQKLVGRWSCNSCKILKTTSPRQGFLVPH